MLLKTTKKAILANKTKENQRRERDILVYGNNNIIIVDEQIVEGFKDYLVKQKQSSHVIRNKIQYVKRFSYILQKENAQGLMPK